MALHTLILSFTCLPSMLPPPFHSNKLILFLVHLKQMYITLLLLSQSSYKPPKFLKTYNKPFWYWIWSKPWWCWHWRHLCGRQIYDSWSASFMSTQAWPDTAWQPGVGSAALLLLFDDARKLVGLTFFLESKILFLSSLLFQSDYQPRVLLV